MRSTFVPMIAFALVGTGSGSAAAMGPVEFTIAHAGAFTVWYAEGGICSPEPGPHWQMSSDDRHAGVGSVFDGIARIVCAPQYVDHFEVDVKRAGHETQRCSVVLRAGRLHVTSGPPSRCVLSPGARLLTVHDT